MNLDATIKKALVVISPDLIEPDKPMDSMLLKRAVKLAKTTGCDLELFHTSYDSLLDNQIFTPDDELQQQRSAAIDRDATLLAEIAAHIAKEGVIVRYEARWDHPRIDAILRKIDRSKPQIVLKQSREHSFVLGISSNTDWDLARRSPAHVWLVNEEQHSIDRIVVAVGNRFGDPQDFTSAADYDLFRVARLVAKGFDSKIFPVNAFQAPDSSAYLASVAGAMPPLQAPTVDPAMRDKLIRHHESAVEAMAQFFHVETNNVLVREGHPSTVIPEIAEELGANMIVMGARSISRLERLVRSVTVEPVMAETKCDILVIRDNDECTNVSVKSKDTIEGVPMYDLIEAIAHPEEVFSSPYDVVNAAEISIMLRKRILQVWEYDICAELAEENEGGPARDVDASVLSTIRKAKAALGENEEDPDNRQLKLSIASH